MGGTDPLPETVTCNLTPSAAWSLGTEVLLPTLTDDDLALEIEPGVIPDSKNERDNGNEDEDDVAGSQSKEEEEKGASIRIKITPQMKVKQTQNH